MELKRPAQWLSSTKPGVSAARCASRHVQPMPSWAPTRSCTRSWNPIARVASCAFLCARSTVFSWKTSAARPPAGQLGPSPWRSKHASDMSCTASASHHPKRRIQPGTPWITSARQPKGPSSRWATAWQPPTRKALPRAQRRLLRRWHAPENAGGKGRPDTNNALMDCVSPHRNRRVRRPEALKNTACGVVLFDLLAIVPQATCKHRIRYTTRHPGTHRTSWFAPLPSRGW